MSKPRTVVFAINSLGGGGAESHTLRVVNNLDRQRFRPIVAVSRRGGSYESFVAPDVPIEEIGVGTLRSSTARQLSSSVGLRLLAKRERPAAVLLVMDWMAVVGIPTLLTLGTHRPKIVPVVQIPPTIEYSQTGLGRSVVLPGIKHLYHRADRVISLSHGVAGELQTLDARLNGRVSVIHNACVDDRLERREEADLPECSKPIVLAAGRLLPQKGFSSLLDAFARVRRQENAVLWILGEGPDRPALEAKISALGLRDDVVLLGFRKNPFAFMRRASVFCLSSIYEGFGNVVVEAMACGTPVVATSCPHGPSEIIRDETEGLLVPPASPHELAASLLRVLRDGSLRTRMSEGGAKRAQDFHARAIAAAYSDELDRICSAAPFANR